MVPAFIIYALPLEHMERKAFQRLGVLYSGSSMMKNDFLYLCPVSLFTSKAPRRISIIPAKYIRVPTHEALLKKAPANRAITGSLAPQGMKGVSMAVALLSLSFFMVRQAMIPGMAQPVPITIGITDFPDSPTRLKIGSSTTVALAMYPQSSRRAMRKYITITSGKNPTTAPTPPIIPSMSNACINGEVPEVISAAHSRNVSIHPTSASARKGPKVDCEISNTANITAANMRIPQTLFVRTASILS